MAQNIKYTYRRYKFRIYPNKSQEQDLIKTIDAAGRIRNLMLADANYYPEYEKVDIPKPEIYIKEYSQFNEVDISILENEWKFLSQAFENHFNNPEQYKIPQEKFDKQSYTIGYEDNNIKLLGKHIELPQIGKIKIKQHRTIPDDYTLKSVTIIYTSTQKWYASILFGYEYQMKQIDPKTIQSDDVIGLDYSMSKIYVDNNGNIPHYPKFRLLMEDRIKKEKCILDRMEKGSNNYKKQCIKIAKLDEKIENQHTDFFHKEARKLANKYKCVCIESLKAQDFINHPYYPRSKYENKNGWGLLSNLLKYKLKEQGKYLRKVGRYFASSQYCHICNTPNPEMKDDKQRIFKCSCCKKEFDRDVNAAINIKNKGLQLLHKYHH